VLGADRSHQGAGQQADTIAILHVDFHTSRAVLVSIPQDLLVKAPSGRLVEINSFYDQGATAMVQAVTAFTGLPIDHYVEVNFTGFRTIVDTLGGVRIRFSRPVDDPDSGLDVPAGCVSMDGDRALAFVRLRTNDPAGDYGRIARQQFFVRLVMGRLLSAGTLLNPVKVVHLVGTGAANVRTDRGLGAATMERLAFRLRTFGPADLDFRMVPSRTMESGGRPSTVSDAAQSAALFDAIKNGAPLPGYGKLGADLSPASVHATVLNGTSTPGLTARAEAGLTAAGYAVVATGNAGSDSYASTVVYYRPGSLDKAGLLAQVYGGAPVAPLPPEIRAGGDAVVVLGRDYAQGKVTAVPSAAPMAAMAPAAPQPTEPVAADSLQVSAC
jgi:LCP family protein required for cell wall assembly